MKAPFFKTLLVLFRDQFECVTYNKDIHNSFFKTCLLILFIYVLNKLGKELIYGPNRTKEMSLAVSGPTILPQRRECW